MTTPGTFSRDVIAMTLFGLALSLTMPCQAEPADDGDFAALQANAKKSFRDDVTPFVRTYCTDCHGDKKRKGGINFQPALKNPGDAAFGNGWKQSLASVKTHDIPAEESDTQPPDEGRPNCLDRVGRA